MNINEFITESSKYFYAKNKLLINRNSVIKYDNFIITFSVTFFIKNYFINERTKLHKLCCKSIRDAFFLF